MTPTAGAGPAGPRGLGPSVRAESTPAWNRSRFLTQASGCIANAGSAPYKTAIVHVCKDAPVPRKRRLRASTCQQHQGCLHWALKTGGGRSGTANLTPACPSPRVCSESTPPPKAFGLGARPQPPVRELPSCAVRGYLRGGPLPWASRRGPARRQLDEEETTCSFSAALKILHCF